MVARLEYFRYISMHEYMHARDLDRYLQHAVHSASEDDTDNFYMCRPETAERRKAGNMVKK